MGESSEADRSRIGPTCQEGVPKVVHPHLSQKRDMAIQYAEASTEHYKAPQQRLYTWKLYVLSKVQKHVQLAACLALVTAWAH